MDPKPLEIYQVKARWGRSDDPRPCVILDPPSGSTVTIALISSAKDLYDRSLHFWIDKDHPDFRHTGLKRDKSCYVAGDMIRETNIANLLRRRGSLTGELKDAFLRWM
jgi:mRNA-degrading endonuclease toxin of MazEF toxin-antitoxin module